MPLDDGSLARGWVLRGRAFWLIRTVPVGIFAVRVRRAGGGGYRSLNKPYMAMGPVAIYGYLSGISRRRPNPFWARGAPMRRSPPLRLRTIIPVCRRPRPHGSFHMPSTRRRA